MNHEKYRHRLSEGVLSVTDERGKPLSGAVVSLKLINHEFLFGCGAFDCLALTDLTEEEQEKKPFCEERAQEWLGLFNYGTLPFYWGRYEPMEGQPREESLKRAASFLTKRGVKLKGHPLCWHTVCADWLMDYDNKTILEKQLSRIDREVRAFRGLIDVWDVINEVVIMPVYDRYDNAVTRICRDLGRVGLVKEVFAAARAANPDALLLINDFNLSESYRILLDGCLNAGVPIGAIGLQTHQHQGYRGKEWLEELLERYSVFGIPLHFTENTLVSGHLMPGDIVDLNDYQPEEWPTTPEGEERQAGEWREMLEILFACKNVEAVTAWDFADGAWLGAPSGLIRRDNSQKPAYRALKNLIKGEWTTDTTVKTDERGLAHFEGFRGTYLASLGEKQAVFTLTREGKETKICL